MSSRSLTGATRDIARRARNILKMTDPDKIAAYVLDELNVLGLWTKEAIAKAQLSWILNIITMKRKKKPKDDDTHQFHLWDDLDQVFDLSIDNAVVQKELGDFMVPDIEQLTAQKADNITAVIDEKDIWDRAASYVTPLLKSHPKWTWRDAVKHMRKNGELPAL